EVTGQEAPSHDDDDEPPPNALVTPRTPPSQNVTTTFASNETVTSGHDLAVPCLTVPSRAKGSRAPTPAGVAPTEPDLSVDPNQTAIANHIRSRPELAEVILDIDGIASDIVGHFMGLRPLPMREVCEAIDRAWRRVRAAKRSSTPATPR